LRDKSIALDLPKRIDMAIDIATGVQFLHSRNIIHRDLKSSNLLVDADFHVVLSDFGVSRVVSREKTMTTDIGTPEWMAPEVLDGRRYSEKADVYSFGIILWELITRELPFSDVDRFQISIAVCVRKQRPKLPKNCHPVLARLVTRCWDHSPDKRPNFTEILEELTKLKETFVGAIF